MSSEDLIADLIVRCLENEGVEYVFGIPGEENIHLIGRYGRRRFATCSSAMSRRRHHG